MSIGRIVILCILTFTIFVPSVTSEKIAWLTKVKINDFAGYFEYKVNIYDSETQALDSFEITLDYSVVDHANLIDGKYEDDPLIAINTKNELHVYRFDQNSVKEEICHMHYEHDLWAMSYYEGWLYAIEHCVYEDTNYGYDRLVRYRADQKEVISLLPNEYGYYESRGERLIVSSNNSFARAAEFDDYGIFSYNGIMVWKNQGNHYSENFIPLFMKRNPYSEYSEDKYFTIAPAMVWLDNDNILCFLVRQEGAEEFPGISVNDAVVVNTQTCTITPYLLGDNTPLVLKKQMLSGFQALLMPDNSLVLMLNDNTLSLYPNIWSMTDKPVDIGSLSLMDGTTAAIACYQEIRYLQEEPVEQSSIIQID